MSKRFFSARSITMTRSVVLTLLFLILAGGLMANTATAGNTVVRIGVPGFSLLGQNAYVDVTLDNTASLRGFGGYDLLIAYDASALSLEEATAGALLDSCGWEYFSYRLGPQGNCGGPCPSGLLRIVAIAETNNGDIHPGCFFSGKSGNLATLKFLVTDDPSYECEFVPISFYWLDCSDNVFSSISGDTLYISNTVYDYLPYEGIYDDITGQPGYGGWQGIEGDPDCLNSPGNNQDTALVFYNGGVDIVCVDSIDNRGDLNLNNIANEIADLVMYDSYFLYGPSAFDGHVEASVAASDVNADGNDLTFRDAAYLMRIVYGVALPYPKQPQANSLNAYFHQDTTSHRVSVTFAGQLTGAFMLVRGDITPTFLLPVGFDQLFYFDGTFTRILILGNPDHRYGSGFWFTYQGAGKLESVETTDWHDAPIVSHITYTGTGCGDFDGSGSLNIADAVYLIRHIFGGGYLPINIQACDVNCDDACNIGDIVYLLAYMFSGGPAPCENCK